MDVQHSLPEVSIYAQLIPITTARDTYTATLDDISAERSTRLLNCQKIFQMDQDRQRQSTSVAYALFHLFPTTDLYVDHGVFYVGGGFPRRKNIDHHPIETREGVTLHNGNISHAKAH